MTSSRRQFLGGASVGLGSWLFRPVWSRLAAEARGRDAAPPQRFVFVVKSSGILPEALVPPTLDEGSAAVNGVVDCVQTLQLLMNTRSSRLHLFDFRGQIV